jgi:dipeptidase E
MKNLRQIIAMGGGGFSMEPDNPLLDEYVWNAFDGDHPRICFISTASNDSKEYIENFYRCFEEYDCVPQHLSLSAPPVKKHKLEAFVLEQNIIYVGGGNTKYMLEQWRETGLESIMRKAYASGVIMAGVSAGAICWFEQGLTDSIPGKLTRLDCLGILKGSASPHYDGENERRPAYHRFIGTGEMCAGYGIDDGCALHFVNEQLYKVVRSRPSAQAHFVETRNGKVVEAKVAMR